MIPLYRPTIRRRDMDRVLTCMVTDRLGAGSLNRELVAAVAKYLGLSGGVALASYYDALLAAVDSLELEPGAGVIISALSPSVYLAVLASLGLHPLLGDVDDKSGVLSIEEATRLRDQGAAAVLVDYTLGFMPDMTALVELGLPVVEDLSQALGCFRDERQGGTLGAAVVISLDPSAVATAGGGGVVLADAAVGRKLRALPSASLRPLPDLNASLGLAQIRDIESYIAARKQIAAIYDRSLQRTRHRTLVQEGEGENVHYSFPVILESGARDVHSYARKKGVETKAAHEGSVIASVLSEHEADSDIGLPRARAALMRCVLFPLYPALGKTGVAEVSRVLSTLP